MTARPSTDLFEAVVGEEAQHPSFQQLASGPERLGARRLMQQTFDQWDGADPHLFANSRRRGLMPECSSSTS